MPLALIPVIAQLASQLIGLYAQAHSTSKSAAQIASLGPTIVNVTAALSQLAMTFKTAQDEKWTENDARWLPIFDQIDHAQQLALDRLT